MSKQDLQARINTDTDGDHIFVDEFDDLIWLSVNVRGGHARVIISIEQAQEMIAAMQKIIEAQKVTT
jgi:hypothetical protein